MRGLSVIGLNHRTAPVAVREQFALTGDLAGRLLHRLRQEDIFQETLVLDTCNRTEVYFVARDVPDPLGYLLGHIGQLKQAPPPADTSVFYRYNGLDAVRHLFRVAAALDSQVVGEHQILGQVRDAYRQAIEARTAKFLLNKLLHWAFRAGKRVRTETDLSRGCSSVAQAAVEMARQILSTLAGKTVLLIGAGQTAEAAARALLREGIGRLIVANRTPARAQQLADDLLKPQPQKDAQSLDDDASEAPGPEGCPALAHQPADAQPEKPASGSSRLPLRTDTVALEDLPSVVSAADLIISSTGSAEPVLTYEALAGEFRRSGGSVIILDIAVPRDVDPRLAELPNVFLYSIDDLDLLVTANLDRRRQEVPRAEAVVEDEVQQFRRWLDTLQVAPTIQLLRQHFDALRKAQVARYGKQFSDADRDQIDRFTRNLCGRMLHGPLAFLRGCSEEAPTSEVLATVEIIRRMFNLDALDRDE